jgi:hypothetical protein
MRKLAVWVCLGLWLGCSSVDKGSPEGGRDAGPLTDDASTPTAQCTPSEEPTCCLGGCGDMLVRAACTDGTWSCPDGSRDQRTCPNQYCTIPHHPQEVYDFPGCPNEDYHCPRLKTVYCAMNTLRAQHNTCEQDSDCVAANVINRCTAYGQCPPAMVNRATRSDFETSVNMELQRYCGDSPICSESGSCAYPAFIPRCKQGRCEAEPVEAAP